MDLKNITKFLQIAILCFVVFGVCFSECGTAYGRTKKKCSARKHIILNDKNHSKRVKNHRAKVNNNQFVSANAGNVVNYNNYNTNLYSGIERLISNYDPNVNIGIQIQSVDDGKIVYQHNANRFFIPASSLKIFTAAAALSHFGKNHTFKTKLLTDTSSVIEGELQGNVYLYFDADPLLRYSDVENLVRSLHKNGINKIKGNVYVDDNIFAQEDFVEGWMRDEENLCYAVPPNPIMLDRNCLLFKIKPSKKENVVPKIVAEHGEKFISIENSLTTKRAYCPLKLQTSSYDNTYYFSGCVPPNSKDINLFIPIKNPRAYLEKALRNMFEKNNVYLNGKIKFGYSAFLKNSGRGGYPKYFSIASHSSLPLGDLVKIMLKKSDNLIADTLLKRLGNSYFHNSSTFARGSLAVRNILSKSFGVNFNNAHIVDGSGLSNYNLISPAEMNKLLLYSYRDQKIREPFFNALPISGIDGTLQYRMSQDGLMRQVHAKTGTMTGIVSLAGYVVNSNKKVFSFTILINNFVGGFNKYRKLEDEICRLIYKTY